MPKSPRPQKGNPPRLRVLILEDNPNDIELIQFELKLAGFDFRAKCVYTKMAFKEALRNFSPDLILSDYDLPAYDGASALSDAKRMFPDVPFILVTGAMFEGRAIEVLTSGAKDYVLKNNLSRLGPAVRRALAEAEEHRERLKLEAALLEANRTLEKKVQLRTAELEREIEKRKQLEEILCKKDAGKKPSKDSGETWDFVLYVAGTTPKCIAAHENLKQICQEHLTRPCQIKVINILENPVATKKEQIVATPTLVRISPLPAIKMVGDLSDTKKVLSGFKLLH